MIVNDKKVLGIFGYPIGHTLSPLMHKVAAEYHSLHLIYLAFSVKPADLPAALAGVKALGISGVNLTIPHKKAAIPLVDELSEEAKLIGAINTIVLTSGKLIGHNTDGQGFITSLEKDVSESPKGKTILLLGAGGGARAIAIHLALAGTKMIIIANRTLYRAQELASYLKDHSSRPSVCAIPLEKEVLSPYMEEAEIIINSTPIGMSSDDPLILSGERLRPQQLVCDIVYRPLNTPLLQAAKAKGCRTLDGLGMLIYQGALSFKLWTGRDMPVELVRKRLLQELGS
jgi:shikimate dehydrogenase